MAIDTSKSSVVAQGIAIASRVGASYILAGAEQATKAQGAFIPGKVQKFVMNDYTATLFGGDTDIQDGLSQREVDLTCFHVGFKIPMNQVDGDLCLDSSKADIKKRGLAVARAAVKNVWNDDIMRVGAEIVEPASDIECAKKINTEACTIGDFGKVYGFMDGAIKSRLGATYQYTANKQSELTGESFSIGDIAECHTVNHDSIPLSASGATLGAAIEAANKVGDSVTLSGATAGSWYVFKKASNGTVAVMATSTTAGKIIATNGKAVDNATAAETDAYHCVVIRAEGAQVYGDRTDSLFGKEITMNEEGFNVAVSEPVVSGFKGSVEYASALIAGVADEKAVKFLLVK